MKYVSLTLLLAFICVTPVLAQVTDDPNASIPSQIPDIQEQFDISVTPTNPQPYDTVTVNVNSFSTNIDKAVISYSLNGKVQQSGEGNKSFSFNAGKLGTVSTITIDITPVNGPMVEKSVQISAQSVDILWEADSYVPPFYEGKSFYAPEGQLTFMAMPNLTDASGNKINPKNLIYSWRINDKAYADKSGYGKNSYVFTGDILGQETFVEVHVSDVAGGVQGDGSLVIDPSNAEVYAYENNPTYGILFNNAIQNGFSLKNAEINLSAFPYFFNVNSRSDSSLSYAWSVNSSLINAPNTQKDIVLRNTNNDEGESNVSVGITDSDKIRQNASNNFTMELNQQSKAPFNF